MDLIPGLPDDLARECLFRIHYTQVSILCFVSKAWKSVLLSKEFRLHREKQRNGNQLILLKILCRYERTYYRLILLKLETSIWYELPPIPDFPNGMPQTFRFVIASFKRGFVVVGAKNTRNFRNKVYVFDYLSTMWQRRADMPDGELLVNGCTSDRDRTVYVLFNKNDYAKCIMAYDMIKDEWHSRINLEENVSYNRIYSMIYQSGKIHFYNMWVSGKNSFDKRVLNVWKWEWEAPQKNFLYDGKWYLLRYNGTFAIYKDCTWKDVVEMPELDNFGQVIMWKSKVIFIMEVLKQTNDSIYPWQIEARIFDLKNHEFTKIRAPTELTGVVRGECFLEI